MQNLIFEKSKSIDPYQVPFFWGRLLRNEAVLILERHGCTPPGLFLLRESIYEVGSFAISICNSNKSISHFLSNDTFLPKYIFFYYNFIDSQKTTEW